MTSPNVLKWVSSFTLTFAVAAIIQYWIGDGDQSIKALEWLGIPIIAAVIRLFVWSIDRSAPYG